MSSPDRSTGARLSDLLDGQLSEADKSSLRQAIADDPDVGARYLEFVELHALLHWRGGRGLHETSASTAPESDDRDESAAPERRATRRLRTALVSAVAVLLAVIVWRAADSGRALPRSVDQVGTITRLPGGHLLGQGALRVEQRLLAHQVLELADGLLEFRLDSGARGLLQGPASLTILTADAVALHRGRITVLLENVGQMTVRTPSALVTDLGTEFGVAVDATSGTSSVHVFDGKVRVASRGPGGDELELFEGESGAVAADGAVARQIGESYREFVRSLPIATHLEPREARTNPPYSWQSGDGNWHSPTAWFSASIPGRDASVRISRGAVVTTAADATAGEVFVGAATWIIRDGITRIDGLQGLLDIGFRRPAARVEVVGGALTTSGRLVLRQGSSISIGDGDVAIGAEIFCVGGRTQIEFGAAPNRAPVRANALFGLTDTDRLTFVIDSHGARKLELTDFAALGGELTLRFVSEPPRRDIVLLEVTATTSPTGRFDLADGTVVHRFPDGARLRLRSPHAASGDGVANDVVLCFER